MRSQSTTAVKVVRHGREEKFEAAVEKLFGPETGRKWRLHVAMINLPQSNDVDGAVWLMEGTRDSRLELRRSSGKWNLAGRPPDRIYEHLTISWTEPEPTEREVRDVAALVLEAMKMPDHEAIAISDRAGEVRRTEIFINRIDPERGTMAWTRADRDVPAKVEKWHAARMPASGVRSRRAAMRARPTGSLEALVRESGH